MDTQLTASQILGQCIHRVSVTTYSKQDVIKQQSESVNNLSIVDHISTSMLTKRQVTLNHILGDWSIAICEMS